MFQLETISAKMLDYYVGRPDVYLIDLRSPEIFQKSHIRGAVNIPYEDLEEKKDLAHAFPKDKILVLYCDRGGASMKAARLLARMEYQVRSVIGGFEAYRGRNLVISD